MDFFQLYLISLLYHGQSENMLKLFSFMQKAAAWRCGWIAPYRLIFSLTSARVRDWSDDMKP